MTVLSTRMNVVTKRVDFVNKGCAMIELLTKHSRTGWIIGRQTDVSRSLRRMGGFVRSRMQNEIAFMISTNILMSSNSISPACLGSYAI